MSKVEIDESEIYEFFRYFKFTFTFRNVTNPDSKREYISFGGNGEDIYDDDIGRLLTYGQLKHYINRDSDSDSD